MLDVTFAILLACALAAVVSLLVARTLSPGAASLTFLLVISSISGFLNNMFDRQPAVQLLRFFVLAALIAAWAVQRDRRSRAWPMDRTVLTFFVVYTLQTFNPHWSSVKVGVMNGVAGMLQHGLPMLMFFVAPDLLRTRRDVAGMLVVVIAISSVMAAYGLYQYGRGVDYVRDLGPGFRSTLAREMAWRDNNPEEQVFRPVSFAQDAGAASAFYALGAVLAGAMLSSPRMRPAGVTAMTAMLVLNLVALSLTLYRGTMAAALAGLALVAPAGHRPRRVAAAVVVSLLLVGLTSEWMGGAVSERYASLLHTDRIIASRGMQVSALAWAAYTFPLGMGIGRVGPAANRFSAPADRTVSVPPESYYVCIVFETGLVGLGLAIWIFGHIAMQAGIAVRRVRDAELHPLAVSLAVTLGAILVMTFTGPALYSSPLSYTFWSFAGLLYRVVALERASRAAQRGALAGITAVA